jgi:pyruvate dehydrogenase E2 component (dihydrolipoamide acetyltransferase)
MAIELKLPALGENVEAGVVSKLLISVGDKIAKDQPVLELDTDKATVEVPAFESGTVREVRVKEGDTIKVGQVILTLDDGADAKAAQPEKKEEAKPEQQAAEPEQKIEEKSLDQDSAGVGREEVAEKVEAAREDGREAPREARPPAEAAAAEPPRQGEALDATAVAREAGPEAKRPPAPASPSVRRVARELGVDIHEVTGSGAAGRISAEDVRNYARSLITATRGRAQAGAGAAAPRVELPDFSRWGNVERKPMTSLRRKTAENMQQAWQAVPHVTQFDRADVTDLERLRKQFGKKAEAAGGKLTVTAIALKVVASALKVFPQFNASIDMAANEIVYKGYYHVGVAVDTDRGLLVPVIRDVDTKNIQELSVELNQLAEKARAKKLTLEEMQGGSFTITNLGGIGGTSFTPIVNAPEVAILGISRASHQPVLVGESFKPRLMLPLSLSYDHRVIDGADAARFLRWVAEALEQPFLLALEG